jgi:hypothetical protein
MTTPDVGDGLCDYERQRLENIARNQRVLEALGLVQSDAALHHEIRGRGEGNAAKRRKEDPNSAEAARAAVRRSQRLAGLPVDGSVESPSAPESGNSPAALSAEHDAARAEYETWTQRWCRKQQGTTLVGTASYSHTLMRVMTMSESGLANRVKAIERACGQHAVAKMKLFATVLALEGYVDLAEDASSAYERLRDKLGEPAADEAEGE